MKKSIFKSFYKLRENNVIDEYIHCFSVSKTKLIVL